MYDDTKNTTCRPQKISQKNLPGFLLNLPGFFREKDLFRDSSVSSVSPSRMVASISTASMLSNHGTFSPPSSLQSAMTQHGA
jgi:hypothetical protein